MTSIMHIEEQRHSGVEEIRRLEEEQRIVEKEEQREVMRLSLLPVLLPLIEEVREGGREWGLHFFGTCIISSKCEEGY